ncbi:MAG: PTS sugar transporter subunit IIC [Gemmatimonadota bacterium]
MLEPSSWLLLVAVGVAAALDTTSVGQIMISRPLVSGTLAGWVLGDPQTGLLLGGVLEAVHLGGLPMGGARLPEPGPAAIPGVVVAVSLGGSPGLAAGAALGTVWGLLGGGSISLLRRANGRITRPVDEGRSDYRALSLRHWACIALDGTRGAVLTAVGIGMGTALSTRLGGAWWPLGTPDTVALLLLPGALAGGALLRSWSFPRRRALFFLIGALGGVALAVIL